MGSLAVDSLLELLTFSLASGISVELPEEEGGLGYIKGEVKRDIVSQDGLLAIGEAVDDEACSRDNTVDDPCDLSDGVHDELAGHGLVVILVIDACVLDDLRGKVCLVVLTRDVTALELVILLRVGLLNILRGAPVDEELANEGKNMHGPKRVGDLLIRVINFVLPKIRVVQHQADRRHGAKDEVESEPGQVVGGVRDEIGESLFHI